MIRSNMLRKILSGVRQKELEQNLINSNNRLLKTLSNLLLSQESKRTNDLIEKMNSCILAVIINFKMIPKLILKNTIFKFMIYPISF